MPDLHTTLNYALWIIPSLAVKWADASTICSFTLAGATLIVWFLSVWMHHLKSCLGRAPFDFISSFQSHISLKNSIHFTNHLLGNMDDVMMYLNALVNVPCTLTSEYTLGTFFARFILLVPCAKFVLLHTHSIYSISQLNMLRCHPSNMQWYND